VFVLIGIAIRSILLIRFVSLGWLGSIQGDAATAAVLRAHRDTQRLERSVMGEPAVDLDLVFTRVDGSPLPPAGISQHFQVKRKQAGLPHIRLHDLRHGAATLALAGNVNAELVRRHLGHADIATTVNTYQRHKVDTAERAAAETVSGLIDAAPVSKAFANGGAGGAES